MECQIPDCACCPAPTRATRATTLLAAVARLASARGRNDTCAVAVDAAIALRSSASAVLLVDGDDLVLADQRNIPDAEARTLARITVGHASHPVATAARTQRFGWSPDECAQSGALPLRANGKLVGVLWVRVPRATEEQRATLEDLALHVAVGLAHCEEIARLEERAQHAERLVAVAAHDLRSPLQVISMGAGLLRRDDGVPPAKRFLVERILESAARVDALVEGLLVAGKARLADGSTRARACAFTALESCVEDFRLRMPACPIALSTVGDGHAEIDRDHLVQALHNLLANAAHYRAPGSTVEVRGIGAITHVYLEVQNRGPVIDDVQMAELFAPMKRGTHAGERGSIGLGLYIVKALIEGDGGRVWARSSAQQGTTFVIALPRTAQASAGVPERAPVMVAAQHTRAPVPPAYAALLAGLPEGPLVRLLEAWLALGGASYLPHPRRLDRGQLLAHLPDMFWVDVQPGAEGRPQFRLLEVGGVLERRLDGHSPDDTLRLAPHDPFRPSMYAAYARCADTRRPAFDYVESHGDGSTFASFTRLVLPFSHDGEHVTQLIGMALFRGFDDAQDAPSPAPEEHHQEEPS